SFIVHIHSFYGWLARWLTVLTLLRRSRGRKSSQPRISTQFFDLGAGAVKNGGMSLEPRSSLQSCRHLRIIRDKEAYVALVADPGRIFSEALI
ncbi:MAG: hypothetical protein WBD96_00460, partial [Pseudolabrys sp.]